MNTVKEPNITQKEYEEALKELHEALLPPSDYKNNRPWEELEKEMREKYGV